MAIRHDRRLFERLERPLRVKCNWQGSEPSRMEGTGVDISGTGIKVRLPRLNTEEKRVDVEITEPGRLRPVQGKAKMVWRDKPGSKYGLGHVMVGFEFTDVSLAKLGELFPASQGEWQDSGGLPQD